MDLTLGAMTVAALSQGGNRPCIFDEGHYRTYEDVRNRVSGLLAAFDSCGVRVDQRVALLGGNRADVVEALLATYVYGTAGGSLGTKSSLNDHLFSIDNSDIEVLIFDPMDHEDRALEISKNLPALKLLALGASSVGENILAIADSNLGPNRVTPEATSHQDPDSTARLLFTGGTTGRPKAVLTSHKTNAWMTLIQLLEWQWPMNTRTLVATPISHSGKTLVLPTLLRGGCLILSNSQSFTAKHFSQLVADSQATCTLLVPTMLYRILDEWNSEVESNLSSLESIFYGAAPISERRLEEGLDRLGSVFVQFYGQAEAPLTACVMRKQDHDRQVEGRLQSCGQPVRWVEVSLLDSDGEEVDIGEAGEICIRGSLVMQGYANLPEETAAALEGGWLHTGDIARRSDDGFLSIIDRAKDIIITGGFNIYPREVEEAIESIPEVSEAAVVGVQDEQWGEIVCSAVVLTSENVLEPERIASMVRELKGSIYAPKKIRLIQEMPVSPFGKVDKRAVADLFTN